MTKKQLERFITIQDRVAETLQKIFNSQTVHFTLGAEDSTNGVDIILSFDDKEKFPADNRVRASFYKLVEELALQAISKKHELKLEIEKMMKEEKLS